MKIEEKDSRNRNRRPALAARKRKSARGRKRTKKKTKARKAKSVARKVVRRRGARVVKKSAKVRKPKRRSTRVGRKTKRLRTKAKSPRKTAKRKARTTPSKPKRKVAKKPARTRPSKGRARKRPTKKPSRAKPTRRVPKRPTPRRKKAVKETETEKVLARSKRTLVEVSGARGLAGEARAPGFRELAPNVFFVEAGSIYGYEEAEPTEGDRVMVSGHASRWYRDYAMAFEKAFLPRMKMTRFDDPDDAPFFRFGILVRRTQGFGSKLQLTKELRLLAAWLSERLPRGWTAHIIEEGRKYSVRVNMGFYEEETQFTDAIGELKGHKRLLDDILDRISGYGGSDPMWFPFWEWEEFEGGS